MGTTTLSLFAGFALLIYAGVMAYECKQSPAHAPRPPLPLSFSRSSAKTDLPFLYADRSASDVQGVSGLPFNVAAILASAFALTLFGESPCPPTLVRVPPTQLRAFSVWRTDNRHRIETKGTNLTGRSGRSRKTQAA